MIYDFLNLILITYNFKPKITIKGKNSREDVLFSAEWIMDDLAIEIPLIADSSVVGESSGKIRRITELFLSEIIIHLLRCLKLIKFSKSFKSNE